MKVKFKKTIFMAMILVIIFILIGVAFFLYKSIREDKNLENKNNSNIGQIETLTDGTSINKRTNFEKVKMFEDYEINNMVFTSNNNVTTIIANIKNTSNTKLDEKIVTLKLLDKQNNEIITLSGIIRTLDANESTTLTIKSTLNYIDAYDYAIN